MSAQPRPDPVFADLLDDLLVELHRYLAIDNQAAVAVTLWTAHTHVFELFDTSPYLAITSPEKRSGKTRLLDVLELLVAKPWRLVTPSEAVVYRKVAADAPTLLLDETDAIFGPQANSVYEGLRALLNAGNRRGTTVPRCVGDGANLQVQNFSVYCPKALAGIGKLPDTVADRSIAIRMARRRRSDHIERFRYRQAHAATDTLRQYLAEWADEARLLADLGNARPELPDELDDRAQDSWEPLLALADLAGGPWPGRTRKAAVALSTGRDDEDEQSLGVHLLADVRTVFDHAGFTRLPTTTLLDDLVALDESPWGDMHGKPITPHRLRRLLYPYCITPIQWHDAESRGRGYARSAFEDAWARYLPFKAGEVGQVPICRENVENQSGTESVVVPLCDEPKSG